MKHASFANLVVVIGVLSACAPGGGNSVEKSVAPAPAQTVLGDDPVLSRIATLPPQELTAGECGLFLWLKRDDVPLIFYQGGNGNAPVLRVDGQLLPLVRTSASDQILLGFFRKQGFAADNLTISVSVEPESTRSIGQGLKVPSGLISLTDSGGWSVSLPVAGVIGCK